MKRPTMLGNWVLLKPIHVKKEINSSFEGITDERDKYRRAEVFSSFEESKVSSGDIVEYDFHATHEMDYEKETYRAIREQNIICIL